MVLELSAKDWAGFLSEARKGSGFVEMGKIHVCRANKAGVSSS